MTAKRLSQTPEHYEGMPLHAGARLGVWLVALASAAAGVALALSPPSGVRSAAAGILLTTGGIGLVAAYRLGTFEIIVTRVAVTVGWGPFARALPRHAIIRAETRPARGWCRLYAPDEVTLSFAHGERRRRVTVPTREAEGLCTLLDPGGAATRP